jgi:SAM-dependent methyltransferase
VRLWTGDATAIAAPDGTYEAVFDFGIIHHVPDWRRALSEAHRVLKPGGRLYAEEVLRRFVDHPLVRRLFDHPEHDRFDARQFRAAIEAAGLEPLGSRELGGGCAWFVAVKRPVSARSSMPLDDATTRC